MPYFVRDRKASSISSQAEEGIDKQMWPYALWRRTGGLVLGETIALFYSLKDAKEAARALNALEELDKARAKSYLEED